MKYTENKRNPGGGTLCKLCAGSIQRRYDVFALYVYVLYVFWSLGTKENPQKSKSLPIINSNSYSKTCLSQILGTVLCLSYKLFNPHNNLQVACFYSLQLTRGKAERGSVTCPRSGSWFEVDLGYEPVVGGRREHPAQSLSPYSL